MPRRKTNEEFLQEMKELHPDIQVLEPYVNKRTKIKCKCLFCENEWETTPDHLLYSKSGCPICGNKKGHEKLKKSHEDFLIEMANKKPTITVLGTYSTRMNKIKCQCNVCNHIWEPTPSHLLYRNQGCPKCAGNIIKKTTEDFIKELSQINPDIQVIGQYINSKAKIQLKCLNPNCNCEWEATPHNLLQNKSGCPHCKSSKGEKKIREYLEKNNFEYIPQYRFEDCRDKRPLPFDFYLPKLNICIEYDGELHTKSISYFGGDEHLEICKKHDAIKTNYCQEKHIHLIRIPFTCFNDIEKILKQELDI